MLIFNRLSYEKTMAQNAVCSLTRRRKEGYTVYILTLRQKPEVGRLSERSLPAPHRIHLGANRAMQQIALAWEWAKGVASPIIGATKAAHFDDAAGALSVKLRGEDIAYLEEPYLPHRIVGAIDRNPEEGGKLLDVKK